MTTPRTNYARLYCDGSAAPNPGHGAGAYVLYRDGKLIDGAGVYLGDHISNNAAEYAGLIVGLQAAAAQGIKAIEIRVDSQLVVEQVNGRWRVKQPELRQYHAQAIGLLRRFPQWSVTHTPREENGMADKLARAAGRSRCNVDVANIEETGETPDLRTQRVRSAIGDYMASKTQRKTGR